MLPARADDQDRGEVSYAGLHIIVNGVSAQCPAGLSIDQLLQHLTLPKDRVAVERNRQIVPRAARATVWVQHGDVFEIVTFVGGG